MLADADRSIDKRELACKLHFQFFSFKSPIQLTPCRNYRDVGKVNVARVMDPEEKRTNLGRNRAVLSYNGGKIGFR